MIMTVERELEKVLTLLRNKIRERGFTQLEVQEALGWGRSYISQLLTKQKSLRIEQVLLILNVIGVDPSDFFGELYGFSATSGTLDSASRYARYPSAGRFERSEPGTIVPSDELKQSFHELRSLLRGLLWLLAEKGIVKTDELTAATNAAKGGSIIDEI